MSRTYGARCSGWETGNLPTDQAALLSAAALRPEEVATPDGDGATWDGKHRLAVSDVYGTLGFATPLVELPLDRVTPGEAGMPCVASPEPAWASRPST